VAIRQSTEIAQQLKPPSVPNSGVLGAVQILWVHAGAINPSLVIEASSELAERDIPEELAPIIFQIARMVAELGERPLSVSRTVWILKKEGRGLRLGIDLSKDGQPAHSCHRARPTQGACVVLSGGSAGPPRETGRSTAIVAAWSSG
jgi:hypothetical protein